MKRTSKTALHFRLVYACNRLEAKGEFMKANDVVQRWHRWAVKQWFETSPASWKW